MLVEGLVHVIMPRTPGSALYCDKKRSSSETIITGQQIQSVMLPGEISPYRALNYCAMTPTEIQKDIILEDLCPSVTNFCV